MKSSFYNFIYSFKDWDDTEDLIFNARTGAMATLDKEHSSIFKKFCENSEEINNNEFVNQLKDGGFIIDDNINEIDYVKLRLLSNRYNTNRLTLTIAPTMNCNFECIYCYEKYNQNDKRMNQTVKEHIIKYIEEFIKNISVLHISWYGGEPLLAFDIIEELSDKIINICEKNNVNYSANIVTNGYLLTKDIAQKFRKYKINSTQITLDGPQDIHDTRRSLKGGHGTYERIMHNIKETIEFVDNLSIRINTDIDNADRLDEIINQFKENKIEDKVFPYLGFVAPTNDGYVKDKCMTVEMYSKKNLEFTKNIGKDLLSKYPRIIGNYCGADFINSYVIDPDGNLYKCWNDIGIREYCVGNIIDENMQESNMNVYFDYMLYDPTNDSKCIKCKLLPICMGGCPNKRRSNSDGCCDHKFTLEEYLVKCANEIISKNRKADK